MGGRRKVQIDTEDNQLEFETPKTTKTYAKKLQDLTKKLNFLKIKVDHVIVFLEKYPNKSEISPFDIEVRLTIFDDIKPEWNDLIQELFLRKILILKNSHLNVKNLPLSGILFTEN